MNCPTCSFQNREDALYCGMCGTRLSRVCQTCGFPNPRSYRYCIRCGAPLSAESAAFPYGVQRTAESREPDTGTVESLPEPLVTPSQLAEVPVLPNGAAALLEGERRVATIIMADVQGSTDLLEEVGSETWVEIMNRVFQILEAEIYRLDGRVDQFRGDGLVAFFGTSVAHEDDPERGVMAAMAMQRAIRSYSAQLAEREGIDLSLRVGVNTGEVIVASVGDDQTYSEMTAMGEAIALAARMEQSAEAGSVLVSENTYYLTENQFDWLPLGEITVKGISHPVSVYRPLSARVSAERPDVEYTPSLIGRDRELATLIDSLEALHTGRGGIVLFTGEQGMGKMIVLQEVRRHLARQEALRAGVQDAEGSYPGAVTDDGTSLKLPPLRIRELRGHVRSYDQSQPYAVWQDMMRNWLGIRKDEPKERACEHLRRQATALWGDRMPEIYPYLERFLGLPVEPEHEDQFRHLDAEGLRQRFFLAIRSWVERLAQQGPLVLTFNDMHWADTTSLDLLKYCLPLCDELSLLWLFVYRPDRLSAVWSFAHYVETEYPHRLVTVTLPPFEPAQSRALIEQMTGPDILPEETLALIIQKAEGNPFFTQELVRSLIADGTLVHEVTTDVNGEPVEHWRLKQTVTDLSLPDSLQGLLMARIDRLAPPEQQVLQRAAVIGSIFWSKVLEAISPDLPGLQTHLTALQRAQLISERGRGPDLGVEYSFRSKLVRDAAYDSMLSAQRTAYHRRVAEVLEAQFEADPAAQNQSFYYGELATHYQYAKQPDKELVYTLKNAERAKELYANAEACQHYTHALRLLETLCQQSEDEDARRNLRKQCFQVLMGRHQVYYLMGEHQAMRTDAEALLPLARELPDDPLLLIDALLHQPGVGDYQSREEIERGILMAEEALALSQEVGDSRRELESLISIINQRLALSDPSWRELAERALELARELGDRYHEARLLVGMGSIFAFGDQPEQSMEYLEAAAALALSEGLEDRVVQMSLLNLLGLEYERSGDYHRLLSDYQQERLHASREIGHRPMESQALQACGRIAGIYLGDYGAGLGALEECRHILRGSPDEVFPLFHMAHIQIAQADHEGARVTLQQIREIGEPIQDRAQASLKLVESMLCIAEGTRAATKGEPSDVTESLTTVIDRTAEVVALARSSPLVSQQYEMAALCQAAVAHLGLAQMLPDPEAAAASLARALETAERAHEIYQAFGFVQIVECVSEEVFFRYSQALAANQQQELAVRFLRRAYDEMMRKYALIPADSHFRRTYLEQIPLHREIRGAYATRVGSILTDSIQPWHQIEPTAD